MDLKRRKQFKRWPRRDFASSAAVVAPALLGHWLLRRSADGWSGGPIVEAEAYLHDDPACHAFSGETKRNRVMWGPPGYAYVYLIYGYHFCVNAVCSPAGRAEAVLIRALEPEFGEAWMHRNRTVRERRKLTNGPAKLCAALGIDRSLDGADLCGRESALIIATNPERTQVVQSLGPIITTTRIGISQAAELPLRFYLEGSHFVSKRARPA